MANGSQWYAAGKLTSLLVLTAFMWAAYALTGDQAALVIASISTVACFIVGGLYKYARDRDRF